MEKTIALAVIAATVVFASVYSLSVLKGREMTNPKRP
jgi:hypothetical protein